MKYNNKNIKRLWGSAFAKNPSEEVIKFTAGRDIKHVPPADLVLASYDVWLNKAHCMMLVKKGVIPIADGKKILQGLQDIYKLIEQGKFELDPLKEDIHTNIEAWLTDKFGIDVAGKLHTARSRNDQTNADTRLFLRDQVLLYISNCLDLAQTLVTMADKYKSVPFPGFTHHQHAMVTTFGHILSGFATMVVRDIKRFTQWYILHNKNPLGNTVAYGTSFPIDRELTTQYLGFDETDVNSMDAITNRWEPEADLAYAITIFMNHASLIAQTLILLATPEFGMVKISDEFSTGSSIMPQKKNPDPLEVIKGKTSYAQGQLFSLLSLGNSNFIGFNRNSQWTKYAVMDLAAECSQTSSILSGVLTSMSVNKKVMEMYCHKGFIGSTTLMEQLVIKYKIPMRIAKIIIEKAVKESEWENIITYDTLLKVLKGEKVNIRISKDEVESWQEPKTIISFSNSFGGPGDKSIMKSLQILKKDIRKHKLWLSNKEKQKTNAIKLLEKEILQLEGGEKYD